MWSKSSQNYSAVLLTHELTAEVPIGWSLQNLLRFQKWLQSKVPGLGRNGLLTRSWYQYDRSYAPLAFVHFNPQVCTIQFTTGHKGLALAPVHTAKLQKDQDLHPLQKHLHLLQPMDQCCTSRRWLHVPRKKLLQGHLQNFAVSSGKTPAALGFSGHPGCRKWNETVQESLEFRCPGVGGSTAHQLCFEFLPSGVPHQIHSNPAPTSAETGKTPTPLDCRSKMSVQTNAKATHHITGAYLGSFQLLHGIRIVLQLLGLLVELPMRRRPTFQSPLAAHLAHWTSPNSPRPWPIPCRKGCGTSGMSRWFWSWNLTPCSLALLRHPLKAVGPRLVGLMLTRLLNL